MESAVQRFDAEEIRCAMNNMKNSEISGPSGVVLESLKAVGEPCPKSLTDVFSDILFESKLPKEWMLSLLVPSFKKLIVAIRNSYTGIKLLEHDFKLNENFLDQLLHISGQRKNATRNSCKTAVSVSGELSDLFL